MPGILRTLLRTMVSPMMMGVLFIIIAVALAIATFIENDWGAGAARSLVYNTRWLEILFLLAAVNITGQMVTFRLYRREKLTILMFHASFLLIIAGAALTRYTGFEGVMHIRKGEEKDYCLTSDSYLGLTVRDAGGLAVYEKLLRFNIEESSSVKQVARLRRAGIDGQVRMKRYIPNAAETIEESRNGEPLVSLIVTSGMTSRESVILQRGETITAGGLTLGFIAGGDSDVEIYLESGSFYMISGMAITMAGMGSEENVGYEPGVRVPLQQMKIYTAGGLRIIPGELTLSGVIRPVAVDRSEQQTGMNAFEFEIVAGSEAHTVWLWDRGTEQPSEYRVRIAGNDLELSLGHMKEMLPFSMRLSDFVVERYPGSSSPSGYKSSVVVIDADKGIEEPYLIYMNNILRYGGYRFYQWSYDKDEKGTILSVSRDRAGIPVTYTGYGLMMFFILVSLVNPSSLFRKVTPSLWNSSLRRPAVVILMFGLTVFGTSEAVAQRLIADTRTADELGRLLVQDQKGRTKPLYTLSSDILRKVSRQNSFMGYTPMQVFAGFYFDFDNWQDMPVIRVSDRNLRSTLGIASEYAAFSDIVDMSAQGGYRLGNIVEEAYSKPPASRSRSEKEAIKLDERVNICYMIYRGDFMKIFPLRNGTDKWGDAGEAMQYAASSADSLFLTGLMQSLYEATRSGNRADARELTRVAGEYQSRFSTYEVPGRGKSGAEILYYRLKIFERLFPFYLALGIVLLIILLAGVITGRVRYRLLPSIIAILLAAGFFIHTTGLGLRWYVSGHSPMSNGYESMIFISWVALLAGFIFRRRSWFALSATAVLSGLTLLVAHMSFMDPEITALVPVLQSYWLTLHVSVITGSYGFLGLGALLGLISLLLITLADKNNLGRISATIDELTIINYRSLTLGLYLLTIGTFLGAIWANESWGRYWGWDPKETWSLITIIVYSFILHSRNIPGMKDIYTFNTMSLFGIASVLMTYFGVNYYLSGLHSYAGGDPVPVPMAVYLSVIVVFMLAIAAYIRYLAIEKVTGGSTD
ncbi:MAG: c-type cytochrome biogenesis protein CcsB [Bacteroidales bacterium]|nr:c-type cytochrome biogenesis protein CcsB [Bacteroidales bacterium]